MKRKSFDVQKFGGREKLGRAQVNDSEHEIESIETQSKTTLERDTGYGNAAIIRCFTFSINPEWIKSGIKSTKQDIFNSHVKGIETMLWRDGMTLLLDVEPRIVVNSKQYQIFVGAKPMRGHILREVPQTLSQLVHGN